MEDSPDDEALIRRALRRQPLPCEVHVVHDGADAVAWLLGDHAPPRPRPDLVLLDLKMPGLNGLDVLRRVRPHGRAASIPIVVFSSSTLDQDVIDCRAAGASDFASKPVGATEFAATVDRIVQRWLQADQFLGAPTNGWSGAAAAPGPPGS